MGAHAGTGLNRTLGTCPLLGRCAARSTSEPRTHPRWRGPATRCLPRHRFGSGDVDTADVVEDVVAAAVLDAPTVTFPPPLLHEAVPAARATIATTVMPRTDASCRSPSRRGDPNPRALRVPRFFGSLRLRAGSSGDSTMRAAFALYWGLTTREPRTASPHVMRRQTRVRYHWSKSMTGYERT